MPKSHDENYSDWYDNGPGSRRAAQHARREEACFKAERLQKQFDTMRQLKETKQQLELTQTKAHRLQALIEECLAELPVHVQLAAKRKLLAIEVLSSDDPVAEFAEKCHEFYKEKMHESRTS